MRKIPKPPRTTGFGSAIFVFIIGLIYKIPLVQRVSLFIKKTALNYMQKQLNSHQNQAKAQNVKNWVDRQKLQLELDEAGDNEPIENYDTDQANFKTTPEELAVLELNPPYAVTSTLGQLKVESHDEPLQKIIWANLETITIIVYEPNPTDSELWFALKTDEAVASFPDWAHGAEKAIQRIFALNGFDHELYKQAIISEGYAEFIAYRA